MSETDEHVVCLGKILANLQSLEFALRVFAHEFESMEKGPSHPLVQLDKLTEGSVASVNALTNYDTLGQLIRKYNARVRKPAPELLLDESIVALRDALAHGRVSALKPTGPCHLLKFGKPHGGKVALEFAVEMTSSWFGTQIKRTSDELKKVITAARKIGLQCFPTD